MAPNTSNSIHLPGVEMVRGAATDFLGVLKRMEERSKLRVENYKLEIERLNGLRARESVTSSRRTKLLRQLGDAERKLRQEQAYLANVVQRIADETAKAIKESDAAST